MKCFAEAARLALSRSVGAEMTVLQSRHWQTGMFDGERLEISSEADLPPDIDLRDLSMRGAIFADIRAVGARRLEVLLVRDD